MKLKPATRPTFYFIGVTTGQSSIMKVFPQWAAYLELGDVAIQGIDLVPNDTPARYQTVVDFLKADPLSLGALVTTHKLDLFEACQDRFDRVDSHARLMAETSCLSKRNGQLICHAKDPITSGLTLDAFLPIEHFANSGAELFSIGAGGSTIALAWHLMQATRGENRPARIVVSDRSQERLDHIRRIHAQIQSNLTLEYVLVHSTDDNDRVLASLTPGSLVVNATGLGKDAPGSPLSSKAIFPQEGIVWELNYRGELVFLQQATAQKTSANLQIENGWTYFLHGWLQVMAEVFDIEVPTSGPGFDAISRIANDASGR